MSNGKPALGFIGIGLMGLPMTRCLLEAGYAVTVWNRSRDKLAPVLELGGREAATPAEVAEASDMVLLCVTDSAAVEAVVFGAGGVAEAGSGEKILVDHSTIHPAAARRMAARLGEQCAMGWVDAPVTGGRAGAFAGKLVILAGGEARHVDAVRPVMAAVSHRFAHMGPGGMGLVTKLCNQLVNSCNKVVLSEMLALARDGGLDGGKLPAVLAGGSADSRQMQVEAPRMAARDFSPPHGTAATIMKDLSIIADFAAETGTALPVTGLVTQLYRMHIADGNGDLDSISIRKLYDRPTDI